MTQTQAMIALSGISKRYRGRDVLKGLDLEVQAGEVVGLIGANGSGKTTILRIIAGLVRPTAGDVWVAGCHVNAAPGGVAPGLGVLFDPPGLLPHLTGLQNLRMLASLRRVIGEDEVRGWMTRLGLDPGDRQPVGTYSQGMLQRLGLVQALMEAPQVLLLDEPTNALDPATVDLVSRLIQEQQARGAAVVVASHYLEEVARICNPVWKVADGHLVPATGEDLRRPPPDPLGPEHRPG